ncbi:MAG TPA: Cof-type HAD-IIB family hydrolase [Gaiellaceae bacterium]|nr:Cof-type HAD-IIB family hydrolase [Gaiellaceae bacterium]
MEPQHAADRGRLRLRRQVDRRPGAVALALPQRFPRPVAAFALDLDRTLIAEDGVLRPRTRDALARTRAAGIHVVIVTGRMFRAVRPYLQQAALDDLVVCYQGAVVADPATGEFLLHVPVPLAPAREAMDAVVAAGFHLNCYVDDLLYVAEVTPEARQYADFQQLEIHAVGDLRAWLDREPTKLVAVGDPDALDELEATLKPRFAGRLFISKSLPYFLEFAHPDVSKGSGLSYVASRLGFRPEETVACGDGENDRELLDWAGFGVAVANAHDDVLERADLVVPSVHEEGVAALLEAFVDSAA